jgi:predicted tellurium resistance membrane protein TerC
MHLEQDFHSLFTIASMVSLLTLSVLEIVLGIDNIISFQLLLANFLKRSKKKQEQLVSCLH